MHLTLPIRVILPSTSSLNLLRSFKRNRSRNLRHVSGFSTSAPALSPPPPPPPPPWTPDPALKKGDRVTVAMSGGVDSSVTLALLADNTAHGLDLDISAVFMRNWSPVMSEENHPVDTDCEWERDWQDVKELCRKLGGVKYEMIDLSTEYWLKVFEPSIDVWSSGQTPNPDVGCNREIKFGALMDRVLDTPSDYLATGHYAGIDRSIPSRTRLIRSKDPTKDQTYYLSTVPESKLARSIFPLSNLLKSEVRELAKYYDLPTATRAESMGVCFIGERGRFGDFISQYAHPTSNSTGRIITLSGKTLAFHSGLWHYTIGQRARLGGMDEPWYVARKDVGKNEVVVVPGSRHPALQCTEITTSSFQWIWEDHPPSAVDGEDGMKARCQVRHRMVAVDVIVRRCPSDPTNMIVSFVNPLTAVSPGQVVGLWIEKEEGEGDWSWCLGSGIIGSTRCLE